MRTHGSKATRHRQAPPGRRTLNAVAQANHFESENALLRDRISDLEAKVVTLEKARDQLWRENVDLRLREAGLL